MRGLLRLRRLGRNRQLNLALQGGGAHGAFTWGVLDRLLKAPEVELGWISGTSAGAINAVALAAGLAEGGRAGARQRRTVTMIAAWGMNLSSTCCPRTWANVRSVGASFPASPQTATRHAGIRWMSWGGLCTTRRTTTVERGAGRATLRTSRRCGTLGEGRCSVTNCACGGRIAQHLTLDGMERRCVACYREEGATVIVAPARTWTAQRRGLQQRKANGTWRW